MIFSLPWPSITIFPSHLTYIYVKTDSLKENKIRIKTDHLFSKLCGGKQVPELVFITKKNNLFITSPNYPCPENLAVQQMEWPDRKPWNPSTGRLQELKEKLK